MTISFMVRTDAHLADRAPESRCDDYLASCLMKLREIGEMATERQVDAVLDNGDFFHNKSASRNSHRMVRQVSDLHKTYPCPVYVNPGNHDFPYANIDYLHQQPLGVLFSSGVFHRMIDHTFEDDSGLKVRVVGMPYKVEFDVEEWDIERGDEDVLVVCAHTFASMKGGEFFGKEKVQSYPELAECTPDVFIFGHWHIDQGIEEVRGKTFINLGSMTRGSLTQDNLDRIPRVGYLRIDKDQDTGEVVIATEALPLTVAPASEVFDLVKHERLQQEKLDMDHFITSLMGTTQDQGQMDVRGVIQSLDTFEEDVRQAALRYLDQAKPT
jgi:predicted phosphodiesterase